MPSEATRRHLSNVVLVVAILLAVGMLGMAVARGVIGSHVGEEKVVAAPEASGPVVAVSDVPKPAATNPRVAQTRQSQTRQAAQNTMGRQQTPNQNQGYQGYQGAQGNQQRTPNQQYGTQNPMGQYGTQNPMGQYGTQNRGQQRTPTQMTNQMGRGRGQQPPTGQGAVDMGNGGFDMPADGGGDPTDGG
jgi:hypothetical protein